MTQEMTLEREFLIACHSNFDRTKEILEANPELLNITYVWAEGNTETPIQGAAHVGNVPIVEYLLEKGAPLEICTASMLGRIGTVKRILDDDPKQIKAVGGHGIPLLNHASYSGEIEIVELIRDRGGDMSNASLALFGAIAKGHTAMVAWLLDNGDLSVTNFQDFTPLQMAERLEHTEMLNYCVSVGNS